MLKYSIVVLICTVIFNSMIIGQNLVSSVEILKMDENKMQREYKIKVLTKAGDEILFPFEFKPSPVHDVYADSNFCTLILSNSENFVIQAAYKDVDSGFWVIDIYLYINDLISIYGSHDVDYHDFKILNAHSIEMEYTIKGSSWFMNRMYGGLVFPRKSKCTLVQRGLYNDELKGFVRTILRDNSNAPRPSIEHK